MIPFLSLIHISGATLVDTAGYLSAIVDAAKNAQTTQAVEFNGSSEDLKLNVVYGAAHGTKCFTCLLYTSCWVRMKSIYD